MFRVEWTTGGAATLKAVDSKSSQKKILDKAGGLAISPLQSGKPLGEDLSGYRSIPAAGRYRLVYRVDTTPFSDDRNVRFEGRVFVSAVGIRKAGSKADIYAIASAMRRRGEI